MYVTFDEQTRIIDFNESYREKTGIPENVLRGKKWIEFLSPEDRQPTLEKLRSMTLDDRVIFREAVATYHVSKHINQWANFLLESNPERIYLALGRCVDEEKEVQRNLERANERLTQMNITLNTLVESQASSRKQFAGELAGIIQNLFSPLLNRLRSTDLTDEQAQIVNLLEEKTHALLDPHLIGWSKIRALLTPMEQLVVDAISRGRTTSEIADGLNISESTVLTHRNHIRRKLGISGKKINLQSYLNEILGSG